MMNAGLKKAIQNIVLPLYLKKHHFHDCCIILFKKMASPILH